MGFKRLNTITGWMVWLIASIVYVLTMEPTGSFWDCGEFIASCYKLQIPHPPGAPMFVLLGRFFIILFGDDPMTAARGVNFMSAMASSFTILFLFWTITHFARKLVQKAGEALNGQQIFSIMAAGIVGALAYTFSDSFWYSAVEGEVYALSSFFTALVFWAILKWEHEVDSEDQTDGHKFSRADRWIIFIFFMMGVSIGVHLLNLLTIPAIVMVYYFKRYPYTRWGMISAFLIGCVITGIVQVVIIQWSIKGAGAFDIFFVNEMGFPFFTGFAIYFAILAGLLVWGLRFTPESIKKFNTFPVWLGLLLILFFLPFLNSGGSFFGLIIGLGAVIGICAYYREKIFSFLKIAIWSTVFMIIGYSTYFTTLIRSNANPSVDMYNVDNPVSLVGYLSREQYGDWPILYGPDYTYRAPYVEAGNEYAKGPDKYEVIGTKRKQDYSALPSDQEINSIIEQNPNWDRSQIKPRLFPRMWDNGRERNQDMVYRTFGDVGQYDYPTFGNNLKYLANYQFNWMYWRYFMWNFAGKQNDLQGFGNIRDGNWNSGISFIDKALGHSTPAELPETAGAKNKANNQFYFLPLILGILGLIYQYSKLKKDFLVSFLLYFFTGLAIVIYLNQAGFQPRERDYAYAGSYYAFAIWIGLGVLFVRDLIVKYIKGPVSGYLAFAVCILAVPFLMAKDGWDDHDRGNKVLARDLGNNYLESVDTNAILVTFGDNDTYPLWYAQEVEGIRKDLRVINYSLLGTDWYINQLRYALNESPPVDVIFTKEQIRGSRRDVAFVYELPGYDQTAYYDLKTILTDVVGSDAPNKTVPLQGGDIGHVFPVKKVTVPVDVEKVKSLMDFNPGDSIVSELKMDIQKNYIQKNDLAILAIIAANNWERPIYFTSIAELESLGLEKYTRMEGLAYRLVPVENSGTALDEGYKAIMEDFRYGNADSEGVYYDEENRRHINSIRNAHAFLALGLVDANRKDSAKAILRKYDENVSEANAPYGMTSNRGNFHNRISLTFLVAAYRSGDLELAEKVKNSLKKDIEQQLNYYQSLGDGGMSTEQMAMQAAAIMNNKLGSLSNKQQSFVQDILSSYQILMQIQDVESQYGPAGGSSIEGGDTLQTPVQPGSGNN